MSEYISNYVIMKRTDHQLQTGQELTGRAMNIPWLNNTAASFQGGSPHCLRVLG